MFAAALVSLALLQAPAAAVPPSPSFSKAAWQDDLDVLAHELEARYAHLAWQASGRNGVNLPALRQAAARAIDQAHDDAEAQDALRQFVDAFHDGHLHVLKTQASDPARTASAPDSTAAPAQADAVQAACATLKRRPLDAPGFMIPVRDLPGTANVLTGSNVFESALLQLPSGRRLGLLRIANFGPLRYMELCPRAAQELLKDKVKLTPQNLREAIEDDWYADLAESLARLKTAGAEALLVDITNNSGGNDAGDWSPRFFTAAPVHSARLLMNDAPASMAYVKEQLTDLRFGLPYVGTDHPDLTARFNESIAAFEARGARLDQPARCDMSWVWREQRPWPTGGCDHLVDMGFASGSFDYLAPADGVRASVMQKVYWPGEIDRYRGTWSGPVYLMIDAEVWSSAEMFAASMRDNGIARVIGTRTGGAGCGFMTDAEPIELPHSHLRVQVPNCVRLRADGTDEVAGIAPDIPFARGQSESNQAAGARLIRLLEDDLSGPKPAPTASR